MACSLINSIPFACRDSVGGIKEIKIKTFPGLAAIASDFTDTSGVIAITGNSLDTWYAYFVEKETASFVDTANNNIQNGTSFMSAELKFIFNKLSATIRNEFNVLRQTSVLLAFRDMNDAYWIMGVQTGADMTAGTLMTGTARGDRSGAEITFTAKDANPVYSISAATYNSLGS